MVPYGRKGNKMDFLGDITIWIIALIVLTLLWVVFYFIKVEIYRWLEILYRKIFKIPPNERVSLWTLFWFLIGILMVPIFISWFIL